MSDPPTLGAYLTDWLAVQRTRLEPSTWASYRGNVDRYLTPAFGHRRLDELTPAEITALYARLLRQAAAAGGRCRCAPCSSATRCCAARSPTPCASSSSPATPRRSRPAHDATPSGPPSRPDLRIWTPAQIRAFLTFAATDPLRELWQVAIGTGMRRGELLGLRSDDTDLDRRVLHVRRALSVVDGVTQLKRTKTNRARSLHVDAVTATALRRRRGAQQRDAQANPSGWANRWNLVFTDDRGQPLDPMRVTHAFARLVRRAPVPVIRLHDLRHLHASQLLALGVPVNVVSQRLGHTQVAMTLDVYAHVLPAMDPDAAKRFGASMYGDGGAATPGS